MPAIAREYLAQQLQQNWKAKQSSGAFYKHQHLDDSLTSLNWLQNLNVMRLANNQSPHNIQGQNLSNDNQNNYHGNNTEYCNGQTPFSNKYYGSQVSAQQVDYKTNPFVKPPHAYASLISMAMKATNNNRITLSGIYVWIMDNFMYYKVADPTWQNSIRHNLSLNKSFQKIPRRKDEPGKGGFWTFDPEYKDDLDSTMRRRRHFKRSIDGYRNGNIHPGIKNEPEDAVRNLVVSECMQQDNSIQIDDFNFNWSAILSQDIQVGEVNVKADDIIDNSDNLDDRVASPIIAFSPPPSESSDIVFDDDFFNSDIDPAEFICNDSVDLKIQGQPIQPPTWWNESFKGFFPPQCYDAHIQNSSYNNNIENQHPWADCNLHHGEEKYPTFDVEVQNYFHNGENPGMNNY